MRLAALAGLVLLVVTVGGLAGSGGGLAQRAFVLCAFGMPLLVAVRMTGLPATAIDHRREPVPSLRARPAV